MNCPKCGKPGLRNFDEWVCLQHDTFEYPVRAWDLPYDWGEGDTYRQRRRVRGPDVEVTEEERMEMATWKPGDPLPGWAVTGVLSGQVELPL